MVSLGFPLKTALKTHKCRHPAKKEDTLDFLRFYLRMGFEQLDKEEDGLMPISPAAQRPTATGSKELGVYD